MGLSVARIYFFLFFSAKDLFANKRTRSLGRKLMKLEIVNKSGQIASPYRTFSRNIIECLLPFAMLVDQQLFSLVFLTSLMDLTVMILFKKRIMDFFLGTRVVSETENYQAVGMHEGFHCVESQSV